MKNTVTRILQVVYSASERHADCRRPVCGRYRRCVPPPDAGRAGLFACPFDAEEDWHRRNAAARKIGERLMHADDEARAKRGLASRFAAPPPPGPRDHLNLSQPIDIAALLRESGGPHG